MRVVRKWVDFMQREKPYWPWTRTLSPKWKFLLEERKGRLVDVEDFVKRREYWESVLSAPTYTEVLAFWSSLSTRFSDYMTGVTMRWWPFCWQLCSVAYGTVTLLAFRNVVASVAFVVVLVSACISIAPDPNFGKKIVNRKKV